VRSPAEFAEDHIPGATNHPVLDDAERARVGTIYTQVSAFEANKVGAALISRNIALHLERDFHDRPRNWRPLIYCWRGGKRSGALAQVLSEVGWRVARLDGGYKAYRRAVIDDIERLPERLRWRVLCGTTGSGKSRLLRALERHGAQVLDLEQLASHRGSVLGSMPDTPQPSQRWFESLLWRRLRELDPAQPVFVESESRRIGRIAVPAALLDAMWRSPCIVLDADAATRVALLLQDYPHFSADAELLVRSLVPLAKHYGNATIAHWQSLAAAGATDELVRDLLARHYDPAYLRSIRAHYQRLPQALALRVDGIDDDAMRALAAQVTAGTCTA